MKDKILPQKIIFLELAKNSASLQVIRIALDGLKAGVLRPQCKKSVAQVLLIKLAF